MQRLGCSLLQSSSASCWLAHPASFAGPQSGEQWLDNKLIIACRGFVGDPSDVQDIDGHGSHVARMLIENAPAAEFYIAKVSNRQRIPNSQLPQVADMNQEEPTYKIYTAIRNTAHGLVSCIGHGKAHHQRSSSHELRR
jgi:hypothetical protein